MVRPAQLESVGSSTLRADRALHRHRARSGAPILSSSHSLTSVCPFLCYTQCSSLSFLIPCTLQGTGGCVQEETVQSPPARARLNGRVREYHLAQDKTPATAPEPLNTSPRLLDLTSPAPSEISCLPGFPSAQAHSGLSQHVPAGDCDVQCCTSSTMQQLGRQRLSLCRRRSKELPSGAPEMPTRTVLCSFT